MRFTLACFCLLMWFKNTYSQNNNFSSQQKNVSPGYLNSLNQPGFVKNAGQFTDENNNQVKDILYGTSIGNCGIYITSKGLSYINYKVVSKKSKTINNYNQTGDTISSYKYDIERIDITLEGALIRGKNAVEITSGKNEATYNYYNTSNPQGITGLQSCRQIIIKDVYPGIDWKVQITPDESGGTSLKYDFIVNPGGDVGSIKLRYSKNAQIRLTKNGDLAAQTALTSFTEKAPVSFFDEDAEPVSFQYELTGQVLSFNGPVKKFDKTVIIDPDIYWATFLSASQPGNSYQNIVGNDIASDSEDNIFVTLTAYKKIPFITANPGNGAFYQDYAATPYGAMIIMKFSPAGKLLWSTYFSGNGQCGGNLMTIKNNGNLYATGKIIYDYIQNSDIKYTDIPLKDNGGYFDTKPKKNFITEFDNNGRLLWSSFFGGSSTYPQDITSDNEGNLYLTGWSEAPDFPLKDPGNGAYMEKGPVSWQLVFVSQFGPDNNLLWSTHIEGNDYDPDSKIEVDRKGNIYIGSELRSTTYPLFDAGGYFNPALGLAIIRFNKDRHITWCTGLPGAFSFADIAVDEDCNLYVATDRGYLRKFNEKTELVWTQQYTQNRSYFYHRMVYDKANKSIQILGQMNDFFYDFPTKNTSCNGSFFYNGQGGKFWTATCPVFMTYTTDGDLQYCSLADWPYEYYEYCNFTVDTKGNLIYLFKDIRNSVPIPALTDPGNDAYYQPVMNVEGQTAFIMKLTTSTLNITSDITLSNSCDSNNIIDLTVLCGTAPFKYVWSNGADSSFVKLPSGNYSVTVTDANFLTKILRFYIPAPPGSINTFIAEIQDTHCGKTDGSLSVKNIEGGNAPFTFAINDQPFTNSDVFIGIDSGNYIISVKDANGCVAKGTFTINDIPGPAELHSLITPASCGSNDGVILVADIKGGSAPYTYSVDDTFYQTDSVFTDLPPSNVAVSIKDAFGCGYSEIVVIQQSIPPDSVNISITPDHCLSSIGALNVNKIFGGNEPFSLSVNGSAYSNQTNFDHLKSGSYNLVIKDDKGCLLQRDIHINNMPGPGKIHYKTQDAVCGKLEGLLMIDSVSGGIAPYTFSVNRHVYQAGTVFPNVPKGTNSLTVKDNFGCTFSETPDIKFIKQFSVDILPNDTSVCYGQSAPLYLQLENRAAIQSIQWNTGEQRESVLISPLQNSSVTVKVIDNNGCIINDTAFVRVKACNTGDKCMSIPTAFTPNRDGLNDAIGPLVNGCSIKDLLFQVYNRFGQKVFETTEPGKQWDGMFRGQHQPAGVYVYHCSFISGGDEKSRMKGSFMLLQ